MATSDKALAHVGNFICSCITSINETRKSKQRQDYEEDIINDYIISFKKWKRPGTPTKKYFSN